MPTKFAKSFKQIDRTTKKVTVVNSYIKTMSVDSLFEELNKKGTTIIFATHSQEIIKRGEHRIINLSQGKAVES